MSNVKKTSTLRSYSISLTGTGNRAIDFHVESTNIQSMASLEISEGTTMLLKHWKEICQGILEIIAEEEKTSV